MTMLNEHLELHISQKLMADDELSSQRVEVHADNGIVTLAGEVQSYRRKLAAQQIATGDSNVVEVRNEIVVNAPLIEDDETVTEAVIQMLDQDNGLATESITVAAKAHVVSLTGYVNTESEKSHAADIAASADGVREVTNFLVANPDQVAANRDHCKAIMKSIAEVIGMENEDIRLSVVNETARLSGSVDALWKKETAESVVRTFSILNVSNVVAVDTSH